MQQPAKNKVLATNPSAMCFFIVWFVTPNLAYGFGLTKKAEPRPTGDKQKPEASRTKSRAAGRWLRRLVRPQRCHNSIITSRINRSRLPMLYFRRRIINETVARQRPPPSKNKAPYPAFGKAARIVLIISRTDLVA